MYWGILAESKCCNTDFLETSAVHTMRNLGFVRDQSGFIVIKVVSS